MLSCDHSERKTCGKKELIIHCKGCKKDFEVEDCISNLILAMLNTYGVDRLILADYKEKQFGEKQLEIFFLIKNIIEKIENYSSRKVDRDGCDECSLKPSNIYPELRKDIILDIGCIFKRIRHIKEEMGRCEGCEDCKDDLKVEIEEIGKDYLELESKILSDAFGIIG